MKYLSKREIQLAELEILKEFMSICQNNNINYYLYAGTALGAARHKGFIPWDDDIDILVPRKDYEKLRKILKDKKDGNPRYIIEFPEDQKKPKYLFAKMYDKNVRLKSENGVDAYLWIDLFQLDGIGNKKDNAKKNRRLVKKFIAKRYQEYRPEDKEAMSKPLAHRVLASMYHSLYKFVNYEKFVKKIEKQFQKYDYNESHYYCNNTWSMNEKDIIEKKWLEGIETVKFENLDAKVFSGYKQYLENRYGKNYMKLPPKNMRVTHTFKAWKVNEK